MQCVDISVCSCVSQQACGGQRLTCRHWLCVSFLCGGSRINSGCGVCQHVLRREHSLRVCYWMLRINVFPKCACSNTGTQPMWSYSVMDSPSLWRCVCFCQGEVCEVPIVLCDFWSSVLKSMTSAWLCLGTLTFGIWPVHLACFNPLPQETAKEENWRPILGHIMRPPSLEKTQTRQRETGDIYKWLLKCTFFENVQIYGRK